MPEQLETRRKTPFPALNTPFPVPLGKELTLAQDDVLTVTFDADQVLSGSFLTGAVARQVQFENLTANVTQPKGAFFVK